MSIGMRTTVYVEGKCRKCSSNTWFYAQLFEMEMQKSIQCRQCNEGYIEILKYSTSR